MDGWIIVSPSIRGAIPSPALKFSSNLTRKETRHGSLAPPPSSSSPREPPSSPCNASLRPRHMQVHTVRTCASASLPSLLPPPPPTAGLFVAPPDVTAYSNKKNRIKIPLEKGQRLRPPPTSKFVRSSNWSSEVRVSWLDTRPILAFRPWPFNRTSSSRWSSGPSR